LASVTIDDVRDTINISSADISDSKILKMLKRAEVVEKSVQRVIKTKVFLIMGNLAIQLTGD
jgi:DNA-binding transcriptional regulator GbsR (MarR family)